MEIKTQLILAIAIILGFGILFGGITTCEVKRGEQLNRCIEKTEKPLDCSAAFKAIDQ